MSADNDQSQTWHFECGPGKPLPEDKAAAFNSVVPKAEPQMEFPKNVAPPASGTKCHIDT